ncbi:MAG: outer membrane protein transport protein [Desulfobacterales bacterium]|nr:outer membrane protein transport protein [Desulfobacterales bacterium]
MKKIFILVVATIFMITCAGTAFAGSVDYLINQSIDYYRIMSRNAATDAADIVNYNPAGTVRMKDGIYLNVSTQYLMKDYEFEVKGSELDDLGQRTKYTQDEPTRILPNIYSIYKKGKYSGFLSFTVPAGGGDAKYNEGLPFIQELVQGMVRDYNPAYHADIRTQSFEGSSVYLAGTVGGAYAINDEVSVSLGLRYINATKEYKGFGTYDVLDTATGTPLLPDQSMELDAEETADGFGAIIGVDYAPMDNLNLAMRYESQTDLKWKAKVTTQELGSAELFVDGQKSESNLPALLGLGVQYDFNPKSYITASFNYYFINQADAGTDSDDDPFTQDYDDDYDNGWEIGIGYGYRVMPDLELSGGYLHTDTGANSNTYDDFEPLLDANTIGLGLKYSPDENLDFTVAFATTYYDEGKRNYDLGGVVEYNKHVYSFGFGMQYRFHRFFD